MHATSEAPRNRLVLALGNPLQHDDGLGRRAIELLAERQLPPDVDVEDAGTPGWGLVNWLQDWQAVLLVDAAEMGLAPGEWRCFPMESIRLDEGGASLSLHSSGVVESLALANTLGVMPEELTLYCMQPEHTDMGIGLSPAVETALNAMVDNIHSELWKRRE